MKVVTLSSSSKGNCVLIMGEKTNILIDLGITVKTLLQKLSVLNVDPSSINAILSTHEHSDHTKGIGPFLRKYNAGLYVNVNAKEIMKEKIGKVDDDKIIEFYNTTFSIDEFEITPFKLPHDSVTCFGYRISDGKNSIAYATDLGVATKETIDMLKNCKLVILESNHDETMLMQNNNYSLALKKRILGRNGHLSNLASAKVVCQLALNNVKQVVLAHLSLENNTPELAYKTHCDYLLSQGIIAGVNIKIDIAPPYNLGNVFVLK